jgi:hypothetical protein
LLGHLTAFRLKCPEGVLFFLGRIVSMLKNLFSEPSRDKDEVSVVFLHHDRLKEERKKMLEINPLAQYSTDDHKSYMKQVLGAIFTAVNYECLMKNPFEGIKPSDWIYFYFRYWLCELQYLTDPCISFYSPYGSSVNVP